MNRAPMTIMAPETRLNRVLSFPLVVLYGLGVTIGAGIYVLVGETTSRAGSLAPFAFALAALVMIFPALSFAELAVRYPFASGSAQYAEEGLKSRLAGFCVGMAVITAGLVTAATISLGAAGYLQTIVPLPPWLLLTVVVLAMGGIAAWGIKESVLFASAMTVVEISGLLAIILGGVGSDPGLLLRIGELVPDWNGAVSFGILHLVVVVALLTVGAEALAGQSAPLSFLFAETTGLPPLAISLIAIVATLNGVIVQIIMISRLSYGLSSRGLLPEFLSQVNERTRTPLYATALATAAILGLALSLHIVTLAEWTSRIILLIFAIVCLSLLRLKLRGESAPKGAFQTLTWVPAAGVITCMALLGSDLLFG
jgi:amino acid transporter